MMTYRTQSGLAPGDAAAEKMLAGYGIGEALEIEIVNDDSPSVVENNRFFAIAQMVFENWPESQDWQPVSKEHLISITKRELGFGDYYTDRDGKQYFEAWSTSFPRCSHKKRLAFHKQAIELWEKILCVSVDALSREIA